MSKHTPGPYCLLGMGNIVQDKKPAYFSIANVRQTRGIGRKKIPKEEFLANGYLLSAAPELFGVLKTLLARPEGYLTSEELGVYSVCHR